MQFIAIIVLSISACILYGIVHDQITARICVEYFTIGHPPVFGTDDPTLLGLGWGVIATWWVGVLLGIPLALAARAGERPKVTARRLIRPLAILLVANGAFAALAGIVGFAAAVSGWVAVIGPLARRIPPDRHVPFLVDLWIHNASYLGGFLGGITLAGTVWLKRHSTMPS